MYTLSIDENRSTVKKLNKRIRQIRQLQQARNGKHRYKTTVVTEGSLLLQAKRLHALVYLDLGFINDQDVGFDGTITNEADPHQLHSTYHVVTDQHAGEEHVVAVARQINATETLGFQSFPLINKTVLDSSFRSKLRDYHPSEVVEISALVKAPGADSVAPLLLYKSMLDYSEKERQHRLWLMALDTNVYRKMDYHFGPVLLKAGAVTKFQGGDVIPLYMHTDQVFHIMEESQRNGKSTQKYVRKLILDFFQTETSLKRDK
jgi:hypothetical protein